MATDKVPTKAEFLEALSKKGIHNLEDLIDVIMPETGGYVLETADDMSGWEPSAMAVPMWRYFGIDVGTRPASGRTEPF